MNEQLMVKLLMIKQAELWLKENPLLLNDREKEKFLVGLRDYLENKSETIDDEVYDFLVQKGFIKNRPREEAFMKYLINKHKSLKNLNVLDVGAGRVCSLSRCIAKQGGKVSAMDTNIRLGESALKKAQISAIKKLFRCDEFSKNGAGTNIDKFDLIVGLEPCDATEHIIRQSLKHDKPFDINLCAEPHDSLSGEKFRTFKEWYKYLEEISKEVSIIESDCGFVATNYDFLEQ